MGGLGGVGQYNICKLVVKRKHIIIPYASMVTCVVVKRNDLPSTQQKQQTKNSFLIGLFPGPASIKTKAFNNPHTT